MKTLLNLLLVSLVFGCSSTDYKIVKKEYEKTTVLKEDRIVYDFRGDYTPSQIRWDGRAGVSVRNLFRVMGKVKGYYSNHLWQGSIEATLKTPEDIKKVVDQEFINLYLDNIRWRVMLADFAERVTEYHQIRHFNGTVAQFEKTVLNKFGLDPIAYLKNELVLQNIWKKNNREVFLKHANKLLKETPEGTDLHKWISNLVGEIQWLHDYFIKKKEHIYDRDKYGDVSY